jgi:hypothetical protein
MPQLSTANAPAITGWQLEAKFAALNHECKASEVDLFPFPVLSYSPASPQALSRRFATGYTL